MSDRLDDFTDRAREVLTFAQDEAMKLGHTSIGTEHLLLGLLRVDDPQIISALDAYRIDISKFRSAIIFIIGTGEAKPDDERSLTSQAKAVIEHAVEEAQLHGSPTIEPTHLLLGLIQEENIGVGVLESLGVRLGRLREQIGAISN